MHTEKEAIEILKKHAPNNTAFQGVLQHVKAVQRAALTIAEDIKAHGHNVDLEFIKIATLLHDIGRFQYLPGAAESYKHAYVGAELLRKEGLPESIARVAERHIGAGITAEEINSQNLDLPQKDFIPKTIEEKIICYADKLIFQDRLAPISKVVEKFEREMPSHAALQRFIALHNEIEKLRGGTHTL